MRSMEGQKGRQGRGERATTPSVCEHPWRGREEVREEGSVPQLSVCVRSLEGQKGG